MFTFRFRILRVTMRTLEFIKYLTPFCIKRNIPVHKIFMTLTTYEHLTQDDAIDLTHHRLPIHANDRLAIFVDMQRLVHPAAFLLDLGKDAFGLLLKGNDINRRVVIVRDESRCRREVVEDRLAGSEARKDFLRVFGLRVRDVSLFVNLITQRFNGFPISAHLRRNAGHAGSAEPVEHDVAWFGVVKDVPHDGLVRHLGVIAVRVVDWVVLALRHVRREWLSLVLTLPLRLSRLPFLDEVTEPRIRARAVVWRIRQGEDVFVLADRESLNLSEFRILQLFGKERREMRPPRRVVRKCLSQAYDLLLLFLFAQVGEEIARHSRRLHRQFRRNRASVKFEVLHLVSPTKFLLTFGYRPMPH